MENTESEKSDAHIIVEIIQFLPVKNKTIVNKTTGNLTVTSLYPGTAEKIIPFDTYIQVIDGTAELWIRDKKHRLRLGEGIIIPAHAAYHFTAKEQFKMLSTTIKSGYEGTKT